MRKGQAAMEFLMTYGWAIVAVLLVIGALAYFGIIDPSAVVPDRCTFPSNFGCSDFAVQNPDIVAFTLVNNNLRDIRVTGINISSSSLLYGCGQSNGLGFPITMLPDGEQKFVVNGCNFTASSPKKLKFKISINYNYGQTDVAGDKTVNGEILAKREG
ncbi:MAG TPA: hypothetical protein VJB90_05260 [Candidatus Nanoarchaeia archaeon]|nr:hypothetical protein [Candidatus Nanoarchaeia archaeon]